MHKYHKIPTVFKRDPATKYRTLLEGVYATPALEYLRFNNWLLTEKVDGTNIRVMWQPETGITFGGKTDNAQIPAFLVNRLNEMFSDKASVFADAFDGPVCLYGEGYGAKIQKGGGNYSKTQEFVLFDVKVGDWWLEWDDVVDVASKLDLRVVPVLVSVSTLPEMVELVKGGITSTWGDFQAEGVVARPLVSLRNRNGSRIITKLKTRDFQ
jgi:ATP-dependent RNA circularization protein (DNA/RNA ligase family)